MNKTVFIAGASSGIGQSLAELVASKGDNLQLASRNVNALTQLASDLQSKYKIKADVFYLDVTQHDSIANLSQLLNQVPDIAVCCVGYLGADTRNFSDETEIDKIYATNAMGCISLLNMFASVFKKSGKGTIVGISSIAGDRGKSKNLFYSSAKAAFTSYLDGLRNELHAYNVHVITVKPGYVDTPMIKDLKLPRKLIITSQQAALMILNAVDRKSNIVYVPFKWRFIMFIIKLIPEFVYKKISWK